MTRYQLFKRFEDQIELQISENRPKSDPRSTKIHEKSSKKWPPKCQKIMHGRNSVHKVSLTVLAPLLRLGTGPCVSNRRWFASNRAWFVCTKLCESAQFAWEGWVNDFPTKNTILEYFIILVPNSINESLLVGHLMYVVDSSSGHSGTARHQNLSGRDVAVSGGWGSYVTPHNPAASNQIKGVPYNYSLHPLNCVSFFIFWSIRQR